MALTRVTFRESQVLHAADLNGEGDYRRSLRRRHAAAAHGWGIASGLDLTVESSGFAVSAGLAIDGYGRALVAPEELFREWKPPPLPGQDPQSIFERLGGRAVDVWLQYDLQPAGGGHSDSRGRWEETARLCYTPGKGPPSERDGFDPRRPPGGAAPAYKPHDEPPDSPARVWPVYLGTLWLDATDAPQVDVSWRPYVSVVGQRIVSISRQSVPEHNKAAVAPTPAPRAQLLLDGERPAPRPRRFAVVLPDKAGKPVERLAVNSPGGATLRGHTTLVSDQPVALRPQASDLCLAEVEPTVVAEEILDPELAACLLDELPTYDEPQLTSQLQLVSTPDERRRLVSERLNRLLRQPDLPALPAFARVTLRPITQAYLAYEPIAANGTRFLSLRQVPESADSIEMRRNRLLLEDLLGRALNTRRARRAYALGFMPLAAPPKQARPWSIYRANLPADPQTGQPERRQLRIEFNQLGEPGHPERSQFAVGSTPTDEFIPCLTIDESCTLRLGGELVVEGDVIRRPPPPALPGSPGAGGVAQPSFEEAIASQPEAPSTLDVTITGLAPQANSNWPYTVVVTNTGAEVLRFVVVMESYSIDRGSPADTRVAGGVAQLTPSATANVPVAHSGNLPAGAGAVSVQLTVMAFTPANEVMYESASRDALVTP